VAQKGQGAGELEVGMILERYADLLKLMKRDAEAIRMYARVREIRARLSQEIPPPPATAPAKP
jgi:hypothetical protein